MCKSFGPLIATHPLPWHIKKGKQVSHGEKKHTTSQHNQYLCLLIWSYLLNLFYSNNLLKGALIVYTLSGASTSENMVYIALGFLA